MSYIVLSRETGRREVRRVDLPIVEWGAEWPLCYFARNSIYSLSEGWDNNPVVIQQGYDESQVSVRWFWMRPGPDGNIYACEMNFNEHWRYIIKCFSSDWNQFDSSWELVNTNDWPQDVSANYLYAMRGRDYYFPATVVVYTLNGDLVRTFEIADSDETNFNGRLRVDHKTDTLFIAHRLIGTNRYGITKTDNTGEVLAAIDLGVVFDISLSIGRNGEVFVLSTQHANYKFTRTVLRLSSNLEIIDLWDPFPEESPEFNAYWITTNIDGGVFVSGECGIFSELAPTVDFSKVRKFTPNGDVLGERDFSAEDLGFKLLGHDLHIEIFPRAF